MNRVKPHLATLVHNNIFTKAFLTKKTEFLVEKEFYEKFSKKLESHTPHLPKFISVLDNSDLCTISPEFDKYTCGFNIEYVKPTTLKEMLPQLSSTDLYNIIYQLAYSICCMQRIGVIHNDIYSETNVLITHLPTPRVHKYIVDNTEKVLEINYMVYIIDYDQADLWSEGVGGHDMFDIMESIDAFDIHEHISREIINHGYDLTPIDVMLWLESRSLCTSQDTLVPTTTYVAPLAGKFAAMPNNDILSGASWKNTRAFKYIKEVETQIKYYKRMNASAEVLQLVELDSKPFGSVSEKIITEVFKMGPRTSTQNDGTFNGQKIEIKSARYWAGKDDCVWQHLEPDHDYTYALFALLDFQGWKIWCIKKSLLMGELRDKKIVTFQGKQGWWTRKSAIISYLTPIKNLQDLQDYVV